MKSLESLIGEQRLRVVEAAVRRRKAFDLSDGAGWHGMMKLCGAYNYHEAFKAWRREVDELERLESDRPRPITP